MIIFSGKYLLILIIKIFSVPLFSQVFDFNTNLIPINYNNELLERPFAGGLNRPKIQWIDWDYDLDYDLFILDGSGYLRYFQNVGNIHEPEFQLKTTSFQNLYCGNWFYFGDFDNDNELELCTQNHVISDYISYYDNNEGDLIFIDILSYNSIEVESSTVMTPTFADIDNDNDLDFFTGNVSGTLTFFENVGYSNNIPQFEFITSNWQDIYIVGGLNNQQRHGASAIAFIDLDGDMDLDLSWGDYFQQSLYIIWNSGTPEIPSLQQIIDQFPPNDPLITAGQNMPSFADLDGDNDKDLFVTVLSGAYGNQLINNFYYYNNTGTDLEPIYTYTTDNYLSSLDLFANSCPQLIDIDNDNDLDLFISNQYDQIESPPEGHIFFFRNIGTDTAPSFINENTSLLNEDIGQMLKPTFGDLDNDGDLDLIVGDFNGYLQYFENISNGSNITFYQHENVFSEIDLSGNSTPSLADLDNDGDLDLIIGELNGNINYYKNFGSVFEYNFIQEIFNININIDANSSIEIFDWDQDQDYDLLLGNNNGDIMLCENIGTKYNYNFNQACEILLSNLGNNTKVTLGRLFSQDTLDVIVGISTGGVLHLSSYQPNLNINSISNLQTMEISLMPNPFNSLLNINYYIDIPGNINISITDLNGKNILLISDQYHFQGQYSTTWNANNYASGVYLINVSSQYNTSAEKITLIK